MLPTSGFDYLTEKRFEDSRIVAQRIARRAMMEQLCADSRRDGLLRCVLNKICAFLGWVKVRS